MRRHVLAAACQAPFFGTFRARLGFASQILWKINNIPERQYFIKLFTIYNFQPGSDKSTYLATSISVFNDEKFSRIIFHNAPHIIANLDLVLAQFCGNKKKKFIQKETKKTSNQFATANKRNDKALIRFLIGLTLCYLTYPVITKMLLIDVNFKKYSFESFLCSVRIPSFQQWQTSSSSSSLMHLILKAELIFGEGRHDFELRESQSKHFLASEQRHLFQHLTTGRANYDLENLKSEKNLERLQKNAETRINDCFSISKNSFNEREMKSNSAIDVFALYFQNGCPRFSLIQTARS